MGSARKWKELRLRHAPQYAGAWGYHDGGDSEANKIDCYTNVQMPVVQLAPQYARAARVSRYVSARK